MKENTQSVSNAVENLRSSTDSVKIAISQINLDI